MARGARGTFTLPLLNLLLRRQNMRMLQTPKSNTNAVNQPLKKYQPSLYPLFCRQQQRYCVLSLALAGWGWGTGVISVAHAPREANSPLVQGAIACNLDPSAYAIRLRAGRSCAEELWGRDCVAESRPMYHGKCASGEYLNLWQATKFNNLQHLHCNKKIWFYYMLA